MVYRGRPSAGCEGCRKAKKRCGLEQPACLRCVKLKKECSGYRDTTQLQIQDESQSVILKVTKAKLRASPVSHARSSPSAVLDFGVLTSNSAQNDETSSTYTFDSSSHASSSDGSRVQVPVHARMELVPVDSHGQVPVSIAPRADDIATGFFLAQFTSVGHWKFVQDYVAKSNLDPCLNFAIKACGMAALDNVSNVSIGKTYSRSMYIEALGMLNAALRDPVKSRSDDSLMAVVMLGYFENLTCDSRESIQSWKAHTKGAAQLLKLRGKAQFQTETGRQIFRETRAQILTNVLWDDEDPPKFLADWQQDLSNTYPEHYAYVVESADHPARITYYFASLRSKMRRGTISDEAAAEEAAELDKRLIMWSKENGNSPLYRCQNVEVRDSPHIWQRTVSHYPSFFAPSVWQAYHSIRIMISYTQEVLLCERLSHQYTKTQQQEQRLYFQQLRREMTNAICYSIPTSLGHATLTTKTPCLLVSAYMSIWPLFFAGTCALENIGHAKWTRLQGLTSSHSASSAQAAWILGRMQYISKVIGLKWAAGIASILEAGFRYHDGTTSASVAPYDSRFLYRAQAADSNSQ